MPGTPCMPGPHPAAQRPPQGCGGGRRGGTRNRAALIQNFTSFSLPPKGIEQRQLRMKLGALRRASEHEINKIPKKTIFKI